MLCECRKICNKHCPCVANNLNCTDMCSCRNCENMVEINTSDEEVNNEDEYGSDDEEN